MTYLRLLYLGSWTIVRKQISSFEIIDKYNFKLKDNMNTLIVIFPISVAQQTELLKYSEDALRNIILFMPSFYPVIAPLRSRFMFKSDDSVRFDLEVPKELHRSMYLEWINKGYLNKALRTLNKELLR